jgi:hypothetical protein
LTKNKVHTESLTIRVDKQILDELRRESDQKLQSPNTLINQVLKQYVKWHASAPKAGIFYMSRTLLSSILEELSNEDIVKISERDVKANFNDFFFMFQNEYNTENVLELLDNYARASGLNYKHRIEGTNHFIIIQLDMGQKTTLLLASILKNVLDRIAKVPHYDMQHTDNMIKIRIEM